MSKTYSKVQNVKNIFQSPECFSKRSKCMYDEEWVYIVRKSQRESVIEKKGIRGKVD